MEFFWPSLLWLTLAVPVLVYLKLRKKPGAVPLPALSSLKVKKSRLNLVPIALLSLALVCLILAAARPRTAIGEEEKKMLGVDVALAIDCSGSMRAEDFKPNRMEAAKTRVKEFAGKFNMGRMALVAFAGRAFTQAPLTADGGILQGLIDQLDVGSVAIDGTAIGDAVVACIAKFKDDSVSRVIILLTDGENNAGSVDPISAARAAQSKGIKIYAIGVGTPAGAKIPMAGPLGQKYYLTDENGNVVLAKVDEETLKAMAGITGGQYFRATDGAALKDIYEKIARMEKKEIVVKKIKGYRELFPYPAGAGLLLLLTGAAFLAGRSRVLS
jgi:Ca-activated chloride channel homolog